MNLEPTAVAIFVKTPGMTPLKTRLASTIGEELAEEFHVLSATAVAAVADTVSQDGKIQPCWAVAEQAGQDNVLWSGLPTVWQGDGNLADRLDRIYSTLRDQNRQAVLIGADTPQITSEILTEAHRVLAQTENPQFVIGRADDGGFYLFGGNSPIPPNVWRSVSYSEPTTADQLLAAIRSFGPIHELPTLSDVDTDEDLEPMAYALANLPAPLGEQIRLQQWISRLLMERE
ncbi:TIGR04282 family arsenosugar biosynthesis glycosyltransferase [Thalassoroseus pseudoceratinae]|uniref:TIGR04282 family arsenosugar biosynthesis glycosyltransferase n=1 Tax=Thalassoroseus pseudoceratinae TaxID=2713176 RepID=UPI00141EA0AC|nr:DUF2064 domain-containing protein [Thalassoroseus pseudoceratinae]